MVAAMLTALGILAVIVLVNLVTLTRDAAVLRRAIVDVNGLDTTLRIQGSIGPTMAALLRTGLSFFDAVPPDATAALAAVRGGSIAVYELAEPVDSTAGAELVRAATVTMARRGWTRVVAVRDGGDTVLVFTPTRESSSRLRVCVAVCSQRELIIGEARLSQRELAELVARHCPPLAAL